jgi:hypothetical protein
MVPGSPGAAWKVGREATPEISQDSGTCYANNAGIRTTNYGSSVSYTVKQSLGMFCRPTMYLMKQEREVLKVLSVCGAL